MGFTKASKVGSLLAVTSAVLGPEFLDVLTAKLEGKYARRRKGEPKECKWAGCRKAFVGRKEFCSAECCHAHQEFLKQANQVVDVPTKASVGKRKKSRAARKAAKRK